MTRHDEELGCRVISELNWDSGMDAERIRVTVSDGVATLTGRVDSYAGKVAAQEAAHRVLGIRDVANDIEVHPPGMISDTEIAHAVRHALKWHQGIPHESIESTVANGFVTLRGNVYRLRQRDEAEEAIRDLSGVRDVTNLIQVEPEAAMPEAARQAIREALERQAGREAEHITVSLAPNGAIAVAGNVRSWAERRAVLGAAGHAPGVSAVQDFLTVNPLAF